MPYFAHLCESLGSAVGPRREDAYTKVQGTQAGKVRRQHSHVLTSIFGQKKMLPQAEHPKICRYVIRSAFGGNRDAFVVCGSEDSQVKDM